MMILRSLLFVPITKPKFYESAARSKADAIILDLEDSVPAADKAKARSMLAEAIAFMNKSGAEVFVRINNDPDHLDADLKACVIPGLCAVMTPKVESAAEVAGIAAKLDRFEREKGLASGTVGIEVDFETAKGVVKTSEIISATQRIISAGFGAGDYCRDLNIIPSADGHELLYAFSVIITTAKAAGVQPKGLLGTLFNVTDLDGFEQMAIRSRRLGSTGSPCIHPKQVDILNRVFSPSPEANAWAERVVKAFEERSAQGEAAFRMDGQMVDYATYHQALDVLGMVKAIKEKEQRKP
jgi:citrate lyase subunit beta/citryl-CoA lyase